MTEGSHTTTPEGPSLPDTYQKQEAKLPNSLEELRRDYASEYSILMSAVRHDERRRILAALVNHGGCTYDDLDRVTAFSRRSVREHVYDMQEKGVLDTTDSKTTFVHFPTDDMRLLCEDVLSFFF